MARRPTGVFGAAGPTCDTDHRYMDTFAGRYLEALEAIMVPASVPQAPLSATQNLMRDLYTGGFGVGFDG